LFLIILINLKKNKILISYFPAHFSWYNQILENIFQFIFHCTTKHYKIIHFLKNLFSSEQQKGVIFKSLEVLTQINGPLMVALNIIEAEIENTFLIILSKRLVQVEEIVFPYIFCILLISWVNNFENKDVSTRPEYQTHTHSHINCYIKFPHIISHTNKDKTNKKKTCNICSIIQQRIEKTTPISMSWPLKWDPDV